jgi:phasin protein
MSKHRKAQGHKPPGDKTQKANGKKEAKDKIVAAELDEAVKREEAPRPAPAPVSRPERPAPVKEAVKPKAPEPPAAKAKTPAPPPPVVKRTAPEPPSLAVKDETPDQPARLLETAVDTFERTFKAAGQGTIEVNRKLIDFTRANVSSGFDFAMSLAAASSPVQIMQLQMSYWDERMKVLASQAEELRALSADLVAKTSEPLRAQMRRVRLG